MGKNKNKTNKQAAAKESSLRSCESKPQHPSIDGNNKQDHEIRNGTSSTSTQPESVKQVTESEEVFLPSSMMNDSRFVSKEDFEKILSEKLTPLIERISKLEELQVSHSHSNGNSEKSQQKNMQGSFEKQNQKISSLSLENETLKQQLGSRIQELEKKERTMKELEKKMSELEHQQQLLTKKNAELDSQLENLTNENSSLKTENFKLESQLKEFSEKEKQWMERIQKIEMEKHSLMNRIKMTVTDSETDVMVKELTSLYSDIDDRVVTFVCDLFDSSQDGELEMAQKFVHQCVFQNIVLTQDEKREAMIRFCANQAWSSLMSFVNEHLPQVSLKLMGSTSIHQQFRDIIARTCRISEICETSTIPKLSLDYSNQIHTGSTSHENFSNHCIVPNVIGGDPARLICEGRFTVDVINNNVKQPKH